MSTICDRCGAELQIGSFPFCKGNPVDHQPGAGGAIGDECDVEIKHGLCWPDGRPRRFRSKSEIARVAKETGYTPYVRHCDGDKHVSRWI
jgi:hypothetical protein